MHPINPAQITDAARALEHGSLVVVPTSRWYMVCADATNTEACERIFTAKKRPTGKSLVLVSPSLRHAQATFSMTAAASALATAFWPGDLALVLPWADPAHGYDTVGTPNAHVTVTTGHLGALAAEATAPVAATTINTSGDAHSSHPGPAITLTEVQSFLAGSRLDVAVTIDGGICPLADHMTIVDCTQPAARITRTGVVHQRAVHAALAPPNQPADVDGHLRD